MNSLSTQQQHVVALLSRFFGVKAARLYETNGRSLQRLIDYARHHELDGCDLLSAGIALAQESLCEQLRARPVLESPQVVRDYLRLHFAGQGYESFVVLFVDSQNRLIAAEEMFRGTLTQTAVHPREIVRRALHHRAAGILCAHPHPSGAQEPSVADRLLTETLRSALALIEVKLLDHFIVGAGQPYSFAEQGLV